MENERTVTTPVVTTWMRTARGRRLTLRAIKACHTVIFVVLAGGVLETVRAGVTGRPSRATGPAITATIAEGLVLFASGNRCPLTGLAEGLGADDGRVSDMLLPPWFARHIPSIFATLFGFGLGRLIEAQSPKRTSYGCHDGQAVPHVHAMDRPYDDGSREPHRSRGQPRPMRDTL